MNGNAREKIFKSWTGISEVALIKEVATKGPPLVELCIEYWSRKRKMSIEDYRMFFNEVVRTYVQRLLTERLVCKGEMVLKNVQRDVRTFYYEFACESDDEELREIIMEYIRKKDCQATEDDFRELRFHWELLQLLKTQPYLMAKIKIKLPHRHINLESMQLMDAAFREKIIVELYFKSKNPELLQHIGKRATWDFLVENQKHAELLRWFNCADSDDTYEQLLNAWQPIEQDMYEYALKTLCQPDDVLQDCFAAAGCFFANERSDVVKVLQRICRTRSFEVNRELLKSLPMAHFIFERKLYMLLLCPFVCVRELEELSEEFPERQRLIELIIALRNNQLETRSGFEKISFVTKLYLDEKANKSTQADTENAETNFDDALVTFFEFLCYEPRIPSLCCSIRSGTLQRIPYLHALSARLTAGQNEAQDNMTNTKTAIPTAYELMRKFREIDFDDLNRDLEPGEIVSFSNERLCQRYARRYQLNFLHYLKQHRSSYAVYYLLTAHLQSYAQITPPQLFSACETVTESALEHSENVELVAHCVAFSEILGFDTQLLRSLLKLRRILEASRVQTHTLNMSSLMDHVEALLMPKIIFSERDANSAANAFPFSEYQALLRLTACNQKRHWPTIILEHYAKRNDWWRLLVLIQFFELPLNLLRNLVVKFETRQIGEHLLRALSYEAPTLVASHERVNTVCTRKQRQMNANSKLKKAQATENCPPNTTSLETMTSSQSSCNDNSVNSITLTPKSIDQAQQMRFLAALDQSMSSADPPSAGNIDLFALMILSASNVSEERVMCITKFLELMQDSQVQIATSWNLLRQCVKYHLPILAVMAATINARNIDWDFIVWLSVATDQWNELLAKAMHLNDKPGELTWQLLENAVKEGYVTTVYRGLCVFYGQEHTLAHLFKFLLLTQHQHNFSEKAVHELNLYIFAWSNDKVELPLESLASIESERREKVMQRSIRLFLVHLKHNFNSLLEQQMFLTCICRAGLTDLFGGQIDFCLLNEIFGILQGVVSSAAKMTNGDQTQQQQQLQQVVNNFENLLHETHGEHEEYKRILNALLDLGHFDASIRLATLLRLPICDIVYAKWVASLNANNDKDNKSSELDTAKTFAAYEAEVVEHSLPPEILVNFFLYAASTLPDDDSMATRRKYLLLQQALNVIKKHLLFPNESFDRDQIEYTMIICYLQLDEVNSANLPIYHSEYYEQIMLKERCVLYKSFLELKELAGIEDLNVSSLRTQLTEQMQQRLESLLYRLLDEGDIVEALRLQELFECRPLDLRFIVFCMALAEGVTTIFSMSSEERQLLRDVEKSAFAKFNKRTLDTLRSSCGSQTHTQKAHSNSPSMVRDEFSDSWSTLEFEEIPSKEKRETLETIQGIALKLKHGIDLGKRIFMAYRAAMYLDKEYLDVLRTKDANILLRSVAEDSCLHRLLVVSDIVTSTRMTETEIAELIAYEITTAIIRPRFYIFSTDPLHQNKDHFKNADLWGYNIDRDLHLLLELTPNTTKLGNCLLDNCDALLSYRKYQDNKPYEHSAVFEKLVEIIRIYGQPTTNAAQATGASSTTLPKALSPLSTLQATTPTTTVISNFTTSIISSAASTMNAVVGAVGSNISDGISSPHPTQVLSHKKQNIINIELLIKAHQCFVHECSLEGIANVLNRAKVLNVVLTKAKSWSLIVRMLIGLARYREMYYCFDSLIENEQFESLLGKFDEEKTIGLRQAIIAYLREYQPANSREFFKLAAHHFLMYKDLAEMWENDAQKLLANVLNEASIGSQATHANEPTFLITGGVIKQLRCSNDLINLLHQALQNYTHATENYLLDNKLLPAEKSASMAEVVAMQIDLMQKALEAGGSQRVLHCVCVINIQSREEFRELNKTKLSVPQALILSRGYGYDVNWSEALLSQYVLLMTKTYLRDFLGLMPITDAIIENVVKGYQRFIQNNNKPKPQMEEHLAQLVALVRSVTLKYKLASLLSMKPLVMTILNDQTVYYLKDTNYGRNENQNIPDV